MFCTQCGKQNPGDARFCAYCGARLLTMEAPEDQEMAWDIPDEPLKAFRDGQKTPPQDAAPEEEDFFEPDFESDELRFEEELPLTEDLPRDLPEAEEDEGHEDEGREEAPAPPDPPRPAMPRRPYVPPRATAQPLSSNPAQPNRGHRAVRPGPYPELNVQQDAAVSGAYARPNAPRGGRKVELDEGMGAQIPLSHRPPAPRGRSVTLDQLEDEEALDDLEDWDGDEEEENAFVRVRVWLLSAALVAVLVACAWAFLSLTGPGQLFCARMGWAAPAGAYWKLGDDYLNGQQYKNAAEAYHSALKLDPQNYEGALQLAKTMTLIGDNEDAERALLLCIQLKPGEAEPYLLLSELYERQGRADDAANIKARMPG